MRIRKHRIVNYKCFWDSGDINFATGFNVLIGANNSGKTALLETLRLHGCENKPHRSPSRTIPNPSSEFIVVFETSGAELKEKIRAQGYSIWIPAPNQSTDARSAFIEEQFFGAASLKLEFSVRPGGEFFPTKFPSHG